jgi:pyruvate kinase
MGLGKENATFTLHLKNDAPTIIIAFTLSGNTAKIISKYRPRARIIVLTPYHSVLKKLLLYWGVGSKGG